MIKTVIFAICLAWVWVEIVNKSKWLNLKPFTCDFCMSGWFALGLSIWYGYYFEAVYLMCVAMVGFVIVNGVINKL